MLTMKTFKSSVTVHSHMALFIPCRGELLCPSDWTIFEEKHGKPLPISKKTPCAPLNLKNVPPCCWSMTITPLPTP